MCSKYALICYGYDRKYIEVYLSLGFVLKQYYYLDYDSTTDNHKYHLSDEKF